MKTDQTFAWYNQRTWLNDPETSSFSGSVVCHFSAEESEENRGYDSVYFDGVLELADCHSKARIHSDSGSSIESFEQFVKKIEILRNELSSYLSALEKTKEEYAIRESKCKERNKTFLEEKKKNEEEDK